MKTGPGPAACIPWTWTKKNSFQIIADPEKCLGLKEADEMRVIEWLEDQGVFDYQRVNN